MRHPELSRRAFDDLHLLQLVDRHLHDQVHLGRGVDADLQAIMDDGAQPGVGAPVQAFGVGPACRAGLIASQVSIPFSMQLGRVDIPMAALPPL